MNEVTFNRTKFTTIINFLTCTPNRLAVLTQGLSIDELRYRFSNDEFSALENICHLRDLEMQGYTVRVQRMLDETDPALLDFDGARVAADGNYHSEQPQEALQAFELARRKNVRRLRNLSVEQLERGGNLQGVGRITIAKLVEMMQEHDEGHLEDLRILRQRIDQLGM